jgi:acyl-CoA thioesterase I
MRQWVLGMGKSRHRQWATVIVTAAVLLASACGAAPEGVGSAAPAANGDRTAAATPSPAPPAPAAATPAEATPVPARPRLVVLGDSIAAGYGLRREESFPARLQERIDREGLGFEVVNAGVSGDTSAGGLRRLDWALDGDVRVLVVELGGNDGLRGLPPRDSRANLAAILDKLAARKIPVLLAGMVAPPNLGTEYGREFLATFADLARERPEVVFYPFFLEGIAADPALNQPDGIHPNARGVEEVVRRILPAVEALLARVSAAPPPQAG